MKRRGRAACLVILACLSMGAAWVKHNREERPLRCILPVEMDIRESVTLRGTLQEASRTEVACTRRTVAEQVLVSPGQQVKKDELLAVLRPVEEPAGPEEVFSGLLGGISLEGLLQESDFKNVIFQGEKENALILITAPTDGMVMEQDLKMGAVMGAYRPFITVSDLSKMRMKAKVSEENIGKLRTGLSGIARVEALGIEELSSRLEAIAPFAQPTGSLGQTPVPRTEVTVLLAPEERLRPGYSASAKFVVSRHPDALTLPYSAVGQDEEGSYVWVLRGDRLERQPVICGKELADRVEIVDGLSTETPVLEQAADFKAEKE